MALLCDATDGPVLCNTYLTPAECRIAPALDAALKNAARARAAGASRRETAQHTLNRLEMAKYEEETWRRDQG